VPLDHATTFLKTVKLDILPFAIKLLLDQILNLSVLFQNPVMYNLHKEHLTSGPSVVLTLQRENAIKKLVDLLGPNDPQQARRQSQFLLRGAFGIDPVSNALHGE
jgi:nucleoside diphosphate kinase